MGEAHYVYTKWFNFSLFVVGTSIQNFGWKLERLESLGRPRSRWEDNFEKNLKIMGWEDLNCINMAQDSLTALCPRQ
jgi:hypothetical protein